MAFRARSDATRNREKVLTVARRLITEKGMAALTMDELATAAGVGKGTVYRRFGSRSGLAEALVDDAERVLQESILTGSPPLGPGADPAERLVAFVGAYADFLEENVDLLLEVETGGPGSRFHTGAYAFWRIHVTALLSALEHDEPELLADILLGALSADLYHHLRHIQEDDSEILIATFEQLGRLFARTDGWRP